MNLTFILPGYPWKPVGGYRVVYEHANRLAQRGHQVTVVHPRRLANWRRPGTTAGLGLVRHGLRRLRDVLSRPALRWQTIDPAVRLLYVPEPRAEFVPEGDVVVATFWATAHDVAGYPPAKGRPYQLVQDFYPYVGTREQLEAVWRLPMPKLAVSHWLADMVRQSGVTNVTVVPNGIDHTRFELQQPIADRPEQVLMLCAIGPYKAPEDGVRAMALARAQRPATRFACFGPSRRPAFLPPWIEYHRNIGEADLVRLYNTSRVFLSSSLAEGFCLPAAEAMSCGCAVAATDSGGIREFAVPGETALLSPPSQPAALAANLLQLLGDDALRQRLATAGAARIRQLTWESSTDQLEQALSRAEG